MKKYIIVDENSYPVAIRNSPEEAAQTIGKLAIERATTPLAVREKLLAIIVHEESELPGGR